MTAYPGIVLSDADGNPSGIRYKNGSTTTDYYFVCNWRGDVIQIHNASGILVGSYTYDAWGNVTKHATSADTQHITETNPIRYRGYYYDTETGLYYVSSRYYDPEIGRFINADETEILHDTIGTINGANLFAYCNNDPVLNSDPSGRWIKYRYINDQGARNIGSIKLGTKSNVRYAGCELVAIYNLLVYLKKAQSLQSIIRFAESHNMLYIKTGKLGTDPYRISKFLNYKKIKYKRVYSAKSCFKYAKSGKLCIISYWNNIRSY